MGKLKGFIEIERQTAPSRPVDERRQDWHEVYLPYATTDLRAQGARCMDCGIPFCHEGCRLGNLIPDWNDLVYRAKWQPAINRLHKTNNFPEWTGRLCPAPCEGSCVLAIDRDAVTIKSIELAIVERAFEEGWIRPEPPTRRSGKRVAVIGSGPAGLAAADQLNKAGHLVTVFERSDRIGGLLRYGIPEFKMEKQFLNRRLHILEAEGVIFRPSTDVGETVTASDIKSEFDATLLAGGAGVPRDLTVPGRELKGVYFAMEYLTQQNPRCEGAVISNAEIISAEGGCGACVHHPQRRVHLGRGETRGHHRWRRHRRRLPRHRTPAGRPVGPPVRADAAATGQPERRQPLARMAADLPRLERSRGRWRAGLLRVNATLHRERRRRGHHAPRRRDRDNP